jgi:hypothetical protein
MNAINTADQVAKFNAILKEIATAQARATKGISKALVMCVWESCELKSTEFTVGLLKTLRKSTKLTAIQSFLEHYGNICIPGKKEPVFFDAKKEWTAEFKKEVEVAALNWEDFRVEKEVEALDVLAKLEKLLKDVDTAVKNSREVQHAPLVAMLRNTLASYTAGEALAAAAPAPALRRAA